MNHAALYERACRSIPVAVLEYLAKHGLGVAELLPWPAEASMEEQLHAALILVQARSAAREMATEPPMSIQGSIYAQAIRRWMDAHMTADKPWGWTALGKRELERCLELLERDHDMQLENAAARAHRSEEQWAALFEAVDKALIDIRHRLSEVSGGWVVLENTERELERIMEAFSKWPNPGIGYRERLLAEAEANLDADPGLTPEDRERLRQHLRAGVTPPAALESPAGPAR